MEIALFEPEIPQNTGTIIRTCSCLNVKLNIIEPCGFIFSSKYLKRSAMDYLNSANYQLHNNWDDFYKYSIDNKKRIVLCTTKTSNSFYRFSYNKNDILLFGSESKGVSANIHEIIKSENKITINMEENNRSLNLAVSVAMILTEGLRQSRNLK